MVRELEKELAARRTREKSLSKATGIQLEHWLTALASRCGIKRRMFAGAATGLAMSFPGDARVELARILLSILDESDDGKWLKRRVEDEVNRKIRELSSAR